MGIFLSLIYTILMGFISFSIWFSPQLYRMLRRWANKLGVIWFGFYNGKGVDRDSLSGMGKGLDKFIFTILFFIGLFFFITFIIG
ncbi:MAG: hypothetical protein CVU39_22650 [Chloroflexi bacterium HGW-Chloroflexi-10]|nr:MAG: hypothetical protein CVU39_22650 [Chloroflexi bacterium HGW-Chloroflexi-10]